ncbi:hypothetical protein F5B22DRAFT_657204 [Xylaria bambusicola]|uniref:uncharacterized protein n=1 Tax=Xylaria bambusicola TaxID=326684 RepID=UPI002007F975|nr:uncharacterized protein F5B22DRAFT_657204 [Xylaria bambusicola]KAI0525990.1 hypothetical protein F5B22DRAFT_657204 [Xylaria bambusicola]
MSFHYSSSPHNSATMDMSHSTYMSSYLPSTSSIMEVRHLQQPSVPSAPPFPAQHPAPPHPLSAYPSPATHSPLAKRRESMSKAFKLRRTYSTPNVRPQGMNEPDTEPLGLSGEKKRNRLGYARTNMACGNCRKRKIRCQPVKDDGRCSQCIRLKKDCQFYAVDQQPPSSTVKAGSKPLPKAMIGSAASPPPIAPNHPGNIQTHQSYHGSAVPASHDMRPPAMRPDSYLEDSKLRPGAHGTRSFSYDQGMDNWASTTMSPVPKQGDINTPWRSYPPESPVAPGYAPYPVPASQASTTWATSPLEATISSEGTSRSEDAWPPYQQPTRSMSFSGEHPVQYAMTPSRTYERKASVASEVYQPTSIETTPATSYTTWQQPYQPWYAEGGQHVPPTGQTHSQMDGTYYGR